MNAALVALLIIAMAIASVSGNQPLNCVSATCTPDTCRPVECACGAYKDDCRCCDICFKCPGDQCNPWTLDQCTEGHRCILDDPSKGIEHGALGRCTPENNTETSHTS